MIITKCMSTRNLNDFRRRYTHYETIIIMHAAQPAMYINTSKIVTQLVFIHL